MRFVTWPRAVRFTPRNISAAHIFVRVRLFTGELWRYHNRSYHSPEPSSGSKRCPQPTRWMGCGERVRKTMPVPLKLGANGCSTGGAPGRHARSTPPSSVSRSRRKNLQPGEPSCRRIGQRAMPCVPHGPSWPWIRCWRKSGTTSRRSIVPSGVPQHPRRSGGRAVSLRTTGRGACRRSRGDAPQPRGDTISRIPCAGTARCWRWRPRRMT